MYRVNAEIIYGEKCAPKQRYVTICTRMVYTIVFAQAGVYTPAVIATHPCMLKNQIQPWVSVNTIRTVHPRAYGFPGVRPLLSIYRIS